MAELPQVPDDYAEVKGVDRRLSYFLVRSSYVVCDVGGADGIDSFNMARLASLCICLDIDKEGIANGLRRSRTISGANIEFIRGDCQHLPLKEGSIDLVTCFSVLDHLLGKKDAVRQAISEMSRVLRESGFAAITLPNKLFLPGTLSMRMKSLMGDISFFEQRYSPKELSGILIGAGMKPIDFDSNYPTRIGATILHHNLPTFVSKIPGNLVLLALAEIAFRRLQRSSHLRLFGARFGYLSTKHRQVDR